MDGTRITGYEWLFDLRIVSLLAIASVIDFESELAYPQRRVCLRNDALRAVV